MARARLDPLEKAIGEAILAERSWPRFGVEAGEATEDNMITEDKMEDQDHLEDVVDGL